MGKSTEEDMEMTMNTMNRHFNCCTAAECSSARVCMIMDAAILVVSIIILLGIRLLT